MEFIAPVYSSTAPSEYQHYIDILEKTNHQLGLWTNPYGLMVGGLTLLIAILTLMATILGYWKYKNYKAEQEKEKKEHREALVRQQTDFNRRQQERLESAITIYDERFEELLKEFAAGLKDAKEEESQKIKEMVSEVKAERLRAYAILTGLGGRVDLEKSVTQGSLIKGETLNTIYWYGHDGQRYSFPDEDVIRSWFPDVRDTYIQKIADVQLASITLAGNMVYRAGTRLIKIASDPKIYVVGQGGLIHWIHPESLIAQIFGSDWMSKVVTVKDVYFIDYTVSFDITDAGKFNPSYEQAMAQLP